MTTNVDVLWSPPDGSATSFPCVDCGLITGNFCDGGASVGFDQCLASQRVPRDYSKTVGIGMQRTPLCSYCETLYEYCSFCRGVKSCTPYTRHHHWSGVPQGESREFDETQLALALEREFKIREVQAVDEQRQDEDDQRMQTHFETMD